jgi:hypothetical protein
LPAGELPRYDHVLVIIAENRAFDQIIDKVWAPNINALAKSYGLATNYYGVVHPSHANYIATISGGTFGIHDDDAWYCTRESPDPSHYQQAEPRRSTGGAHPHLEGLLREHSNAGVKGHLLSRCAEPLLTA